MDESDWHDVKLVEVDVRLYPRLSGLREVEPLFSRRPFGDWCGFFYLACEAADDLDWKGAGFALCDADEVDITVDRLRSLTDRANAEFRAFLGKVLINQPDHARDLLEIEGVMAASEDGSSHRCSRTFGP